MSADRMAFPIRGVIAGADFCPESWDASMDGQILINIAVPNMTRVGCERVIILADNDDVTDADRVKAVRAAIDENREPAGDPGEEWDKGWDAAMQTIRAALGDDE